MLRGQGVNLAKKELARIFIRVRVEFFLLLAFPANPFEFNGSCVLCRRPSAGGRNMINQLVEFGFRDNTRPIVILGFPPECTIRLY